MGMWEGARRTHLNLRGPAEDAKFARAAKRALGCDLPVVANTVARSDTTRALWLGPDEWLIVAEPDAKSGLVKAFERAAKNHHLSLTDVSEARGTIVLAGPMARDVLMKGCSLDLHPRAFSAGSCAQSTIALAQVILSQADDEPTYEIYIGRSFATYLWQWLWDASQEYGVVAGPPSAS